MDKEQKRKQIITILFQLAEKTNMSEDYCEELLKQFEEIYSNSFRHFYSDITIRLLSINTNKSFSIDLLSENLTIFCEFAESKSFKYQNNLVKLIDHVTMDVARTKEWDGLVKQYQSTYRDLQQAKNKIDIATKESVNVKKDLISIMGIFMGVFSFIQWNFSQYRDLLEYDPFNRVVYIAAIGSLLIISLYFVFAMIDFIVHKEPRMLKPFFNIATKRPSGFGIFSSLLYLFFLTISICILRSDSSRKTISKIENKIEDIQIENKNKINTTVRKLQLEVGEKNIEYERKIAELNKRIEILEKDKNLEKNQS